RRQRRLMRQSQPMLRQGGVRVVQQRLEEARRITPRQTAGLAQKETDFYWRWNWMVTVSCVGAALPSSIAGWYFHCFKASMAACCSSVCPEITCIVVTRPLASINASIVTPPETC